MSGRTLFLLFVGGYLALMLTTIVGFRLCGWLNPHEFHGDELVGQWLLVGFAPIGFVSMLCLATVTITSGVAARRADARAERAKTRVLLDKQRRKEELALDKAMRKLEAEFLELDKAMRQLEAERHQPLRSHP